MKYLCFITILFFSCHSYCDEKYFLNVQSVSCSYEFHKETEKTKKILRLPDRDLNLNSCAIYISFWFTDSEQARPCLFYKWLTANGSIKRPNIHKSLPSGWESSYQNNLGLSFYSLRSHPPEQISINGQVAAWIGTVEKASMSVLDLIQDKKFLKKSGLKLTYKDISDSKFKQFFTHPNLRKKKYSVCVEYEHPSILDVKIAFAKKMFNSCKRVEFKKEPSLPGKVISCWHYNDIGPKDVYLIIQYVPDLEQVTLPFDFKNIQLK